MTGQAMGATPPFPPILSSPYALRRAEEKALICIHTEKGRFYQTNFVPNGPLTQAPSLPTL